MTNTTHERGFTITEVIIAVVVIGILSGIGYIVLSGVRQTADTNAARTNAEAVKSASILFNSRYGTYPTNVQLMAANDIRLPENTQLQLSPTLTKNDKPKSANDPIKILFRTSTSANKGNCIGYYDYSQDKMIVIFSGAAKTFTPASLSCT